MTLTEKIISLVPEIVELKFGCRVIVHLGYKDEEAIITRWLDTSRNMPQWVVWPIPESGRWFEYCTDKSKMTILGRPITLADVLRAIGQQYGDSRLMVNNLGGFRIYYSGDVMPGWEDVGSPRWNLSQDLDGQSEETKAFISKILGV